MTVLHPLIYKIAKEPWELEAVHRLNYRTFVEEIPQHPAHASRRLVDKFDRENTYIICVRGTELVGMVALRAERPFSLDAKLADLDRHVPAGRQLCEVRLLAVEPRYRKTSVFLGLILRLVEVARARGYDMALISGTTRQTKLYRHLGFVSFGPLVGTPEAPYQPMLLALERFEAHAHSVLARTPRGPRAAVVFMPGPVAIAPEVARAFGAVPKSHRDADFIAALASCKRALRELTGAPHVAIALGSGTLANDMVAAQLAQTRAPGLVLANGEFGERLIDHARRWGLAHEVERRAWGSAFDFAALERRLATQRGFGWLWAVHCETSTGVLNDPDALRMIARRYRLRLCIDAVSSLGTVPLSLDGIALAAGTSGKGLASYPGLALVFAAEPVAPSAHLPRYLDLGLYLRDDAVPFTHSSNLVCALDAALALHSPTRYAGIAAAGARFAAMLEDAGLAIVATPQARSPAVTTIAVPASLDAAALAADLRDQGFEIAHASEYLRARNWVQVCLFGAYEERALEALARALSWYVRSTTHLSGASDRERGGDSSRVMRAGRDG